MSDGRTIPFKDKTASGAVLFSRSDFQHLKSRTAPQDGASFAFLQKAFPQGASEEPFIAYALGCLKDFSRFGVLMIRLDPLNADSADTGQEGESRGKALVQVLGALCSGNGSGWGPYAPDLLCCFFPNKSDQECLETGRRLQERLSRHRGGTVSVGCARYPMVHFSRIQTFENARKTLDHAAFFGPGSRVAFDAVTLNISGDKRYQEGDIPGAIREYQAALKIDPTNVNVLNSLGVCHAVTGNWKEAVALFETALWIDPGEVMARYNLALADEADGDTDRALGRYHEILGIQEDHFETLFQIGRLCFEKGLPEKGRAYLERAVSARPGSGPAHRYLGECLLAAGNIDEALKAFKQAVKINPNDAAALSALGYLFSEIGENPEVALAFCRQSVTIAPKEGRFWYRLALLYHRQGQTRNAQRALSEAVRLGHPETDLMDKIKHDQKDLPDEGRP